MLAWIADPAAWAALVSLTAMEAVLSIENVVFISVLVSQLPAKTAGGVEFVNVLARRKRRAAVRRRK
jgi:predicted tellurium resistance membrane protein TerC